MFPSRRTGRGAGPEERAGAVPLWLLPGEVAALDRPGSRRRRTVRDWLVDLVLFVAALLVWLQLTTFPPEAPDVPAWMLAIDPWVGFGAGVALWWRRRFPLLLAWAMLPVLVVSFTCLGAVMVMVLTVAVHRPWRPATVVTGSYLLLSVIYTWANPAPDMPRWLEWVLLFLLYLAPLGWGMAVRARRQLVVSLRRDTERQRHEHQLRLAGARRAEREAIAREMHDVLAHRISLLSVHAGALAYRTAQAEAGAGPALAAAEVADAVGVIRDNAHRALAELGEVLTVLRSGDAPDGTERPPPRLADLPRLVAEARTAGQRVDVAGAEAVSVAAAPRPQVQRTAYRVVQEGLTNARKHAPGVAARVRLARADGDWLEVSVTNPLPAGGAATIPGTGAGLAGLAERVALDGGTLDHGAADGLFRLVARLPWQA
jgi:signal transduction histidine kinase